VIGRKFHDPPFPIGKVFVYLFGYNLKPISSLGFSSKLYFDLKKIMNKLETLYLGIKL